MTKSKEPKTHFEQVPLEIVKKIAEEDIPDDETRRSRRDRRASGKKVLSILAFQASHGECPVTPIFTGRVTGDESGQTSRADGWNFTSKPHKFAPLRAHETAG